MEIKAYLERIGISDEKIIPSYESLLKLQRAHLFTVPYENIDCLSTEPLSLKISDLYEKVVIKKRGGFCFELNRLFEDLLKSLGFQAKSYFARFWRDEEGIPIRRHRVVEVTLDGKKYICDVGIGAVCPRFPLLLSEGLIQEDFGESYKFIYEEKYGWVLYEYRHAQWQRYFSFTTEMTTEEDFEVITHFCQTHPKSKFNKKLMVALKTPDGRRSIDTNTYKEFVGKSLTYIEENMNEDRLSEILIEKFGIRITENLKLK